jgi:electron-transferring-flavoprotein dehydrogenase
VRVSDSGQVYEDCVFAELTCFGDKGFISKDLIERFHLRPRPQLWSVGVKELWQIPGSLQGQVWHTLGYPVLDGSFGGGFVYGLKDNRLALGLIIGLDSKNPNLNPQQRLQEFKAHPWIQSLIAGGKLLKYGAAVIPEGGYYSLPTRFGVEGALLLGDALGVLDVGSLAGINNAMETGYLAAGLIHDGFLKGDLRIQEAYQKAVMESSVGQDLYRSRYFREAFLENPHLLEAYLPQICRSVDAGHPWLGSLRWGLQDPVRRGRELLRAYTLLTGRVSASEPPPRGYVAPHAAIQADFVAPSVVDPETLTTRAGYFSRSEAVFFADPRYPEGNRHILEFSADTCRQCIATYDQLNRPTPCVADCPAEVHHIRERNGLRSHAMALENCIQCRTCEIVCPYLNLRVNPSYEGSGPDFYGL